jgi:hypothetical protein
MVSAVANINTYELSKQTTETHKNKHTKTNVVSVAMRDSQFFIMHVLFNDPTFVK